MAARLCSGICPYGLPCGPGQSSLGSGSRSAAPTTQGRMSMPAATALERRSFLLGG